MVYLRGRGELQFNRVTQTVTDRKDYRTQLRMVNEILVELAEGYS